MAQIRSQFSGLKYASKADGDKRAYHVFEGAGSMLVVSPGRTRGSYNANAVDRRGLDVVGRRFRGRKITSVDVMKKACRRDLFRQPLASAIILAHSSSDKVAASPTL